MQQTSKCLIVGVVIALVLLMGVIPGYTASSKNTPTSPTKAQMIKDRLTWQLGAAMPSGENVSDQYGSTWINLNVNYRLAKDKNSEQCISLGVMAGSKSKDFYDDYNYGTDKLTSSARIIPLKYSYKRKTTSPLYFGGGLGLYFINTEAKYDAGDGYEWTTGGRYYTVNDSKTAIAPHLMVGYQINDKIGVELGYTMLSTTLAGNNSSYDNLPSTPDAKLSSILSLSGTFKF